MRKVRLTNKVTKALGGNSKGFSLVEVLIGLALLGLIAGAFIGGLSTAFKADIIADERSTAQSLAQSQMEYVKSQDYKYAPALYEQTDVPSGYAVSVDAEPLNNPDDGIQKITVTIKHNDEEVLRLEDYKVDR